MKRTKERYSPPAWEAAGLLLFLLLSFWSGAARAADNLYMHGALVSEPCIIQPGDEDIQLDFGTVADKYLYQNTRTPGKAFEVRLSNCDLSIGKTVSVSFRGTESPALPGFLALAAGSTASGFAIGMETNQGTALRLNQTVWQHPLSDGNTVIRAQAYVRGEPDAITRKTITHGLFNAVATFALEYK